MLTDHESRQVLLHSVAVKGLFVECAVECAHDLASLESQAVLYLLIELEADVDGSVHDEV